MTTKVIHIKDAPKDWKTNPDFIYIGRSGKGLGGYFGNPFHLTEWTTREEVIERYTHWLYDAVQTDPVFGERVLELKDKTLVCFCSPLKCHGDILADFVDSVKE